MKTLAKLAVLLLLGNNSFAVLAQENRGSTPHNVSSENKLGAKRALIIGISEYKAESLRLTFADDDAALFKDYLENIEKIPEKNIVHLKDKEATSTAIYLELDNLLQNTNEGDEVFIYYAGHGDVVQKFNKKTGFLLAYDANDGRNYHGTGGVITLDDLNWISSQMIQTKKAKVNLILDACHSGFLYEDGSKSNLQTLNNNENFKNAVKYLSCGPNEVSIESNDLGHGYFTYYLVLGLMGAADELKQDNKLQYFELNEFITNQVRNQTNEQQSPVVLNTNPSEEIKDLNAEVKREALKTLSSRAGLKDMLASRNTSEVDNPFDIDVNNPILLNFNSAIQNKAFTKGSNNAYEILMDAEQNKKLEPHVLKKMKFVLVNSAVTEATMLINEYISENPLPVGAVFKNHANDLEMCLNLMDEDDFNYDRILVSKLFLEGYAPVRDENYSNYPKARELLTRAVELEPKAAYIHNALGILANQNGEYDESLLHYRTAIKLIPTWSYPVNNIGVLYFDQHQYEKANEFYKKALKMKGESMTLLNNLGAVSERKGHYTQAEALFHSVKNVSGKYSSITLRNIANLYKRRGNIEKAIEFYEMAIETDSSDVHTYYDLSNLLFGTERTKAEELLQKAIELEPYYSEGYSNYGDFFRWVGYDSTEPERYFQKADSLYAIAIRKNPFDAWAYAGRGWLRGDNDVSISEEIEEENYFFKEGIKINNNKPQPYYFYANFLIEKEKENEAEENLMIAIEKDKHYIPAYRQLISLYNSQYGFSKSIDLIKGLLERNDELPDLWDSLGDTYLAQGDYINAEKSYTSVRRIDSAYAHSYRNFALAKLHLGQYDQAEELFKKAIAANPYKFKFDGSNYFERYSISEKIIPLAEKKFKIGDFLESKLLFEMGNRLDETRSTLAGQAMIDYLLGELHKAHQNALRALDTGNYHDKEYEWKLNELLLKICVDNRDVTYANEIYKRFISRTETNFELEDTVQILFYDLIGETDKAKALTKDVHPLILDRSFLKERFSEKAISRLYKLLEE